MELFSSLVLLGMAQIPGAAQANPAPELRAPIRSAGPCDIYQAGGTPCVAAHSTTRALYARYAGHLYQVLRRSDGHTLDIDATLTGYAEAETQDRFCAATICVITRIYDQSGHGNDLLQAPPGTFKGPAQGGFDTEPIADMAPISIMGHKAYGVFIMPGMGLRNNNARAIATGNEPEGIYYVIDGTHYDSGCCFDYGNASTNGHAAGTGTMETTYFGTSTAWGRGDDIGPWIMSDMEAGLFSGYDAKRNPDPAIRSSRFVTAVMNGGGGNRWELRGGDASHGALSTIYSGVRPASRENDSYSPMRRQGAVLLGTGGDNGNGAAGTFYEGVITTGFPSTAITDAVQANIVAARYREAPIALRRITSFPVGAEKRVTATFTNITDAPLADVAVAVTVPAGWRASAPQGERSAVRIRGPVAPGASVDVPFTITAPEASGQGVLGVRATWATGGNWSDASARIRAVLPITINEVRLSAGGDASNQFIELFNSSATSLDISGWQLSYTPTLGGTTTLATVPADARINSHGFYLLGLADSGLAAPSTGSTVYVRNVTGIQLGQRLSIDGERRVVRRTGSAAQRATTIFVPVSTGPWFDVPVGASRLPLTNVTGFVPGEAVGIGDGDHLEVATVTSVGKAGTQTIVTQPARAGASSMIVAGATDLSVGDTLTLDTGDRVERRVVTSIETATTNNARVGLDRPLRLDHRAGVDVSDPGTGIFIRPSTRLLHRSGDAVQALGSGLVLDVPLVRHHVAGAPIAIAGDIGAGYRGDPPADQLFGTALSTSGGALALLDARGTVTDALVYGSRQSNSSANGTITEPEIAILEGDQDSGGCIAVAPVAPGNFGSLPAPVDDTDRSLGRFPDGADTDSNCADFHSQAAATLPNGAIAGATTLKLLRVSDFAVGQTITIGRGVNTERALIATVGSAGATRTTAALNKGATIIACADVVGFAAADTITIGEGADRETAVVMSVTSDHTGAHIVVAAPLARIHVAGSQVSGTGLTIAAPLRHPHDEGTPVRVTVPTPGTPNHFPNIRPTAQDMVAQKPKRALWSSRKSLNAGP